MNTKKAFTLIELLVVIAIIALLMAMILPALKAVTRQARSVVCVSNLRQWGLCYQLYTNDYDNSLTPGYSGGGGKWGGFWMVALEDYYEDEDIRSCPEATKTIAEGAERPFAAWGPMGHEDWPYWSPRPEFHGFYASYGSNSFASNPALAGYDNQWGLTIEYNYTTCNEANAERIPVLVGSQWFEGNPQHNQEPPVYPAQNMFIESTTSMGRFCQNRHRGYVGGVFLDWSARMIGLKELWELQWHKVWYYGVPPANSPDYNPPVWPSWMENFKDFDRFH